MSRNSTARLRAFALLSVAASAMIANGAFAQSQTPAGQAPGEAADAELETIIVTGSRILRPNETSAVPVTSVDISELTSTGNTSLGDALNKLPAMRSTFSQGNSTRFIGTAGLSVLDLRGQGTARTLVLVNGRRHVTAQPGTQTVDVNMIPTELVERVDVVTGGNSAIYGSDAVAGVVNFVLKRNYEGIAARAQSGISSRGDRQSYFGSVMVGENFADNRANITMLLEYSKADTLFNTDRDGQTGAFSGRNQFQLVDNTIGEPATGDAELDRGFFRGIKNNTISLGGLYTSACPAASAATAARRLVNGCGTLLNSTGQEVGRTFVFLPTGELVANPLERDFRPVGSGNAVGGLGSTLRETGMLQPGMERWSANLLGRYEFSEAVTAFVEAKYVWISANQEGQPTFHNNTFRLDNPFLSASSRSLLVSSLAPGATTFTAQRFNVDFGGRGELHRREMFRIVGGLEGTFNDDWRYEVSVNYGRNDTFYRTNGNIAVTRFANALDATRNAAGNIVCRINADTNTANDDPNCVPVNLFGDGAPSKAALDYFVVESTRDQLATQFVASAFVSGDSSQLFELPGGPIGFAIGAEYRRDTANSVYDAFSAAGNTFLNSFQPFNPPSGEVKELFGELNAPVLKDMMFADELSLEASGRLSDYGGNTGTVFAYNLGAVWAPVPDIRFRAGYAKSVRAPTLSDQFSPLSQTFLNGLVDPCSATNINNNPNRRANCAAAGVPTTEVINGVTVPWTNTPASGISGFNSGNVNVREETGKSLTVGFVAKPRFIEGLSLSVDYYRIKIRNVIVTQGAQTVINNCYDNPGGINNPFCAQINRRADGTFAGQQNRIVGGTTISFPIVGPSFTSIPINYANRETSGIDAELNYSFKATEDLTFGFRGIVSYLINRDEFNDFVRPDFADRIKSELGDPQWAGGLSLSAGYKGFKIAYDARYIGRQLTTTYENFYPLQGRAALDPDWGPKWYPDQWYHDVNVSYTFDEKYKFYFGIDNIGDRLSPLDLLGVVNGDNSDNIGRFFYAGVEMKF